jgi:hypothetical protein
VVATINLKGNIRHTEYENKEFIQAEMRMATWGENTNSSCLGKVLHRWTERGLVL